MSMHILGYVTDNALPSVTREDARSLTHINVAFGLVRGETASVAHLKNLACLRQIREWNPEIKLVLSVGGWGAGGFSEMAATEAGRAAFAASCREICDERGFDGIDIDWEYPCSAAAGIGYSRADKENFTYLMRALREALGEGRIVSIAAGAGEYFPEGTQMDKVAAVCDYIQLMTYDLRGGFQVFTGHHANLFDNFADPCRASTERTARMFMEAGVPREKIVIGAAFYGRAWREAGNVNHGYLRMSGRPGNEYVNYTAIKRDYIGKNGFVRYWDDESQAAYLSDGSTFISYEDTEAIARKAKWAMAQGFRGVMYWEHGCDESRELLRTLKEALA